MKKSIKSTDDFLRDIITPIEQNQIDKGNLYVLINSSPEIEMSTLKYKRFENYSNRGWIIPTEEMEPEWRVSEFPDNENYGYFQLATLSRIVWRGSRGGNLYRAEYSGKAIKLTHHDTVHYMGQSENLHEFHKNTIKAEEHIDNCINLGVKTKKTRLTSYVRNWTPFLVWSFAIKCVERQYSYLIKKKDLPDIYEKCLVYANANIRYLCDMGLSQMEELISTNPTDEKTFDDKIIKLRIEFENILTPLIKDDYSFSLKNFGEAVLSCIGTPIHSPFTITGLVRAQHALNCFREYRDEYDIPGLVVIDDVEKDRISKRIWYAFMKQELDWQVQHLREMLGE